MKIFNLIITTESKHMNECLSFLSMGYDKGKEFAQKNFFAVVNPVISDLEKLRADTWNQDKITKIQTWLKENIYDN